MVSPSILVDTRTGLRYSLLPMMHAVIDSLLTPEQARTQAALIEQLQFLPNCNFFLQQTRRIETFVGIWWSKKLFYRFKALELIHVLDGINK